MARTLSIVLFAIIIVYTFTLLSTYRENFPIETPMQTALVSEAVQAIPNDFNETGTLIFYPNNVGPIPYLFFQDQNAHTVAKALVLPYSSPINPSWTGARVSVTGKLDMEHVVVSRIIYLSAP